MIIEAVRGRLDPARHERILEFWAHHDGLEGAQAHERLSQVVCLLVDESDVIAGVNSVHAEAVELIAGRLFWIYRSVLAPGAEQQRAAMISAAHAALDQEFDPEGEGPIGLCVLIGDRAQMELRPEAEWSDPRMLYAGYLPDGRQVRIAYFAGATIMRDAAGA